MCSFLLLSGIVRHMALVLCTLSCSLRPTLFSHGGSIANPRVFTDACRLRTFAVCSSADEEAVTEQRDMAGNGDDEPMGALDYARFFGTIAGFIAFFYAVAAIFPAAAGAAALPTPLEIAAKVDADWTAAHGTAALSRLYTPGGRCDHRLCGSARAGCRFCRRRGIFAHSCGGQTHSPLGGEGG